MSTFNQKIGARIAMVSLFFAFACGLIAWHLALYNAERLTASLTVEATKQLVGGGGPLYKVSQITPEAANKAAKNLVTYGIFDSVEIFDPNWNRLASYQIRDGEHTHNSSMESIKIQENENFDFKSYKTTNGRLITNVVAPIKVESSNPNSQLLGYLDGIRVIPKSRERDFKLTSLYSALAIALTTLITGLTLFPILVNLNREKERKSEEVIESHILLMKSLGEAIAKRDSETGIHNYRVTWIAIRIAEEMGVDPKKIKPLIIGSLLHDVGKIAISDNILLKPGKLSADEMQIMKTHVIHGEDIVKNMGWLHSAYDVVSGHHERWDGSGYPRGLKNEAIPLTARIFAVADVFDALCNKRPYKPALSYQDAIATIEKEYATHFDPKVVKAFSNIAQSLYDRLDLLDDGQIHKLLNERIAYYFDIPEKLIS